MPILKAGDHSNLNNYRPISTLPVFRKSFRELFTFSCRQWRESVRQKGGGATIVHKRHYDKKKLG